LNNQPVVYPKHVRSGIFVTRNAELDFGHNSVTKTIKHKPTGLDKHWFDLYTKVSNKNNSLVKVLELQDENTIIMERLNIIATAEELFEDPKIISVKPSVMKRLMCDITITMQSVWSDMLNFSKNLPDNLFFLHGDFTLHNIVITKGLNVKVVDPDACFLGDFYNSQKYVHIQKYNLTQLDLMIKIQNYYYGYTHPETIK
jgi:thiamine kinase-like enzyme